MEPLSPNDPLWKLLGQSRPVETPPQFLQNVMRAARQTPQERGLLAKMRAWWSQESSLWSLGLRGATTLAAAAVLALGIQWMSGPSAEIEAPIASTPSSAPVAVIAAVNPAEEEAWVDDFFAPTLPSETDMTVVASQTEAMPPVETMLAMQETYSLSDRELALVLY